MSASETTIELPSRASLAIPSLAPRGDAGRILDATLRVI